MERLDLRSLFTFLDYYYRDQTYKLKVEQVLVSNINPYEPVPSTVEVSDNGVVFARIKFDRFKIVDQKTSFFEESLAPVGMTLESLLSLLKTCTF